MLLKPSFTHCLFCFKIMLVFISGPTRLFWNYLHPNQLTFQSSCRTDGTIEFTSDNDKTSSELGEILQERASLIVYKFGVGGYCLTFGAIIFYY